jgi:NADH:ubiquinone reductase (H+-translocating)
MSNEDRQNVPVQYNYLILATGATHSYFGHSEFEKYAPGLKTLADAEAIRNNILNAFERAEAEEDPRRRLDLLTFVLVGAGPTGVEMSGAIGELVRSIKCGLELRTRTRSLCRECLRFRSNYVKAVPIVSFGGLRN